MFNDDERRRRKAEIYRALRSRGAAIFQTGSSPGSSPTSVKSSPSPTSKVVSRSPYHQDRFSQKNSRSKPVRVKQPQSAGRQGVSRTSPYGTRTHPKAISSADPFRKAQQLGRISPFSVSRGSSDVLSANSPSFPSPLKSVPASSLEIAKITTLLRLCLPRNLDIVVEKEKTKLGSDPSPITVHAIADETHTKRFADLTEGKRLLHSWVTASSLPLGNRLVIFNKGDARRSLPVAIVSHLI